MYVCVFRRGREGGGKGSLLIEGREGEGSRWRGCGCVVLRGGGMCRGGEGLRGGERGREDVGK